LVFFDGEPGGFVKLEDLANELKGSADVREVQFRGCNVGNDAKGLDKVKDALGSTSAEGTNCSLEVAHAGPPKINGVDIDTEAKFQKLNAKQKTEYDQSLRRSTHGHGDCIVELSPGQKMASLSADQLRAFAMRHGGKLIMQYAKEDNTCWNDMQFGGSARCTAHPVEVTPPTQPSARAFATRPKPQCRATPRRRTPGRPDARTDFCIGAGRFCTPPPRALLTCAGCGMSRALMVVSVVLLRSVGGRGRVEGQGCVRGRPGLLRSSTRGGSRSGT
jgi:hypothetical protein